LLHCASATRIFFEADFAILSEQVVLYDLSLAKLERLTRLDQVDWRSHIQSAWLLFEYLYEWRFVARYLSCRHDSAVLLGNILHRPNFL
jgi:hypothetical protein